jgi:hypothetical protein
MAFLITVHSLTPSFPLEVQCDLSDFNVLYLIIFRKINYVGFLHNQYIEYLEKLILFIKVIGKELPEM